MIVCSRCKTENAEGRIRCGKCGNNISRRGEYAQEKGPKVVVLGSVEDLKRAQQAGELDTSDEDPNALGWLDSSDVEAAPDAPAEPPKTRRVSVREIDKISGLKDLREIQKALLGEEEAPKVEAPKREIERPRRLVPEEPAEAPPPAPPPKPVGPASAYLVCELFAEPFALVTGERYLVGRDARAPICLPSSEVSRKHAGIAIDDTGSFTIEDLGSMNGTYVNGHAILKRKLREGDVVDVGPFSLKFVTSKPGKLPPPAGCDPNEDTRAIRAIPGALAGEIERNGVGMVLQLLHASKRSGVLTLRAGKQVGRVFISDGQIQHAQFGKTSGEPALAALIPAEAGLLHFTDERIKVKRTITRTTEEILG